MLHEGGDHRPVLAARFRRAFPHGRVAVLVEAELEAERPEFFVSRQGLEPRRCVLSVVVDRGTRLQVELLGEGVEQVGVDGVGNREEEVLFVREVPVDRTTGVARRVRDLIERRTLEATRRKDVARGGDQRGPGAFHPALRRPPLDRHGAPRPPLTSASGTVC